MSNKIYDDLAKHYDFLVSKDIENFRFPYSEYTLVQEIIAEYVTDWGNGKKKRVLDIGIGSAALYEKILPEQLDLTGIDNSEPMLEIAKLRVPDARLINFNIKKGLPEELKNEYFDFIVISYVFMHFDLEFVLYFIDLFRQHLSPFGKLIIGDIMFYSEEKKLKYLNDNPDNTYPDMNYHVFEEILDRIEDNYDLSFMEINQYTGMIIVDKMYQNTLQFEETLIKYNENTEKWKSTQPEKKSE